MVRNQHPYPWWILVPLLLILGTDSVRASDWLTQVRIGVLDHATKLTSSGREEGIDLNLEALFGDLPLWGTPRPYIGLSANLGDDTDQLYGGLAWRWRHGRIFLSLGLGAAVHNGDLYNGNSRRRNLGSRGLFHSALEAGWQITPRYDISLYFQHISNGPLHGERGANQGLDNAGLRLGYSF